MPETTWAALCRAHQRYRSGVEHDGVPEHRPIAAVLGCADARVPPSILFGQPPGALFEVRVAGNTTSPAVLASLDYAVEHAGVELIVVLGHTHCGAVAAALDGGHTDAFAPILDPIVAVARRHPGASPAAISEHNVAHVVAELRERHGGSVTVSGAVHDLDSGNLRDVPAAVRF